MIDTCKPLLAALLENYFLKEPLTWWMVLGIIISTIGIIAVSIEKSPTGEEKEKTTTAQSHSSERLLFGYFMAFINVFLGCDWLSPH